MKITLIHINEFGKLKNFHLNFSGQNLVYGKNEQGKSTVMAFIRAMFYGFSGNTKRNLLENPRKKYMPWGSSEMGGSLEFIIQGKKYRIERSFGERASGDSIKVYDTDKNCEEKLPSKKEPGEIFLGMTEDSFEKSVFIGQVGSVIESDSKSGDEIIKRLQNLVSSGDETQSYSEVSSNLSAAKERLISKSGRKGILVDLKAKKAEVIQEKTAALEAEEKKEEIKKIYVEKLKELEEKVGLEINEKIMLELIKKFKEAELLEKILKKSEEAEGLKQEIDKFRNIYEKQGAEISLSVLDDFSEKYNSYLNEMNIIQKEKAETDEEKKRLQKIESEMSELPGQLGYENAKELKGRINSIQKEKDTMEAEKKMLISDSSILAETDKAILAAYEKKKKFEQRISGDISSEENKKELETLEANMKKKRKSLLVQISVFGVLSTFAAIGGVLISENYLFFAVFIFLGCIVFSVAKHLIYSGRVSSEIKRNKWIIQKEEEKNKEKLNFLSDEIKEIESYINTLEKQKKSFFPDSYYSEKIKELEHKITENNKNLKKADNELNDIFEKNNAACMDELEEKYMAVNMKKSELAALRESLEKRINNLEIKEKNFETVKSIFENACRYLGISPEASDLKAKTDVLRSDYYTYRSTENSYDKLKKELSYELDGRSIKEVFTRLAKIKNETDNFVFGADDKTDIGTIEKEHNNNLEKIREFIRSLRDDLNKLEYKMANDFRGIKEVSETEEELEKLESLILHYTSEYEALELSLRILREAFEEMQRNFGPVVNKKCASILSEITGGRYRDVMVSKDLDINVREPEKNMTYSWKYLSNGTVDQVYFSLRLAIAELFAGENEGLPIFLDDSFLQYDDERARMAMKFIEKYSERKNIQTFLFTCHSIFKDYADKKTDIINL